MGKTNDKALDIITGTKQPGPPPEQPIDESINIKSLGEWLWGVSRSLQGKVEPSKLRDFIFPLILYKRLSDVFDDLSGQEHREDAAADTASSSTNYLDRYKIESAGYFYIPPQFSWRAISTQPVYDLGYIINKAMRTAAEENPPLRGVLDVFDYNEGQRRSIDDNHLVRVVSALSHHHLGKNINPHEMGQIFEYLLQKFAESNSRSIDDFHTPKEVCMLVSGLIDPKPSSKIYDPACGSASLLVNARLRFHQANSDKEAGAPELYGQEQNLSTLTTGRINTLLHGYSGSNLKSGNVLQEPAFISKTGAEVNRFDYVVSNPPWNQSTDDHDKYFYYHDTRQLFKFGLPPKSSADWAWVQHILASLNNNGRAVVVLDTGAVSRGSGKESLNREKEIRRAFVEHDLVESVILLPKNLFYGNRLPAVVFLLNLNKPAERKGRILLINASDCFERKGRKNVLTDDGARSIVAAFRSWETKENFSRILTLQDAHAFDYNLDPSQAIETAADMINKKKVFISYSSKDHSFAERLHADLQAAGVLCWFAPKDLKIGARIRPTIDESIRAHDKLLLILSKHSIESDWVEQEVETTFARERERKETILFPIRLDDEILSRTAGWQGFIRNTRNIGDFRGWEDPQNYKKAFDRLIHDLTSKD